jgi:hypothetical protein
MVPTTAGMPAAHAEARPVGPRYDREVRALKIGGVVLGILALIGGAAGFALDRYLQSSAFKQAVVRSAHDLLGSDVNVGEIHISLFSGVSLTAVTVANPPGFTGDLLRADALVLRYRLWPLLRKRLELRRLALDGPTLVIARRGAGEWNYEGVGARIPAPGPRAARPAPAPEPTTPSGAARGLDVILPELAVSRGVVVVTGESQKPLARLDQLNLTTDLAWTSGSLRGGGRLSVGTLSIADTLFARQVTAPLTFTASEIKLTSLTGKLGGGNLRGDVTVRPTAGFRYAASIQVKDADVQTLLREARVKRALGSGRLQLRASIEGAGGLARLTGQGRAEILDGELADVPLLRTVQLLLQLPFLRSLKLDEFWVDFSLAQGILTTPALRLASRDLRITGKGAVALEAATLDHELTLALPKATVDRAPREVRRAFTDQPDGWATLDFRVWGPYDAPRTDLSDRLLRGVAEGVLRKGLKQLFR